MSQVRLITAADFADDCPVPPDLLGRIIHADADNLAGLLDAIPGARRARLAVWLYGRSHTREIGVRVAGSCDGAVLRREAGVVGAVLHDLSRRAGEAPVFGSRSDAARRINLGGSRRTMTTAEA